IDFLETKYRDVSKDMIKFVEEAKKALEESNDANKTELGQLLVEHPELRKGQNGTTIVNERIAQIQQRRTQGQLDQKQVEAKKKALHDAMNREPPATQQELLDIVAAQMSSQNSTDPFDDQLVKLHTKKEQLMQIWGPKAKEVVEVQIEID